MGTSKWGVFDYFRNGVAAIMTVLLTVIAGPLVAPFMLIGWVLKQFGVDIRDEFGDGDE